MGGSASSGRHTTSPWAWASVSKKAGTVALPLTALWLGISLWQALWLDIGFSLFFVFYAFGYNLAYDHLFPLPHQAS